MSVDIFKTLQERFHTITSSYLRGASGILFVYDITNERSFENITRYANNAAEDASAGTQMILIGNHCENENERQVSSQRGEELAREYGIPFLEVSSKNNLNITDAFHQLTERILMKI